MAEITVQYFVLCPKCNVHTGINPKDPRNLVIVERETSILFIVLCQNCRTKIRVQAKWIVENVKEV